MANCTVLTLCGPHGSFEPFLDMALNPQSEANQLELRFRDGSLDDGAETLTPDIAQRLTKIDELRINIETSIVSPATISKYANFA